MRTEFFDYLITIAESKNMSEAAVKLNMAQSTLSISMKNFEDELGGNKIFEKSGRSNKLTPFGEELYRRAKVITQEINALSEMASTSKGYAKFLSVGNNFSILGKDTVIDIYNSHKGEELCLKIEDGAINMILDNVSSGINEIGIVRFFANKKNLLQRALDHLDLEYETLAVENICVVVGKNNPLFHIENDYVNVEYLANCSFVSHITETMDALWMRCLKEINARKIKLSLASVGNVMAAVRKTDAAFIDTRKDHTHQDWYKDIRYITIEPKVKCELGLIKQRNRELSDVAAEYIQVLKNRIKNWEAAKTAK